VFFNVFLDLLNVWLVLVIVLEKRELITSVCGVSQKIDYLNSSILTNSGCCLEEFFLQRWSLYRKKKN
jgi:hypothetical protein